ncbi:hypothetical protein [Bergeyella sp. RCAD1439]|uniref:hypothetical protein n=1 Tax=Bergeyella anatis TaxID=3113737 RepID=UPI002E196F37|nr:hypothetical protein [Bergeyella sp. RCAD1439]
MSKTAKIILVIALLPPFIFMGYYFFSGVFDNKTRKDYFIEDRRMLAFNFKIDTIFEDKNNRYVVTMKGKSKNDIARSEGGWENFFKVNDSIVKEKDSLKIYIYRNSKLDTVLDYNAVSIR